MQKKTLLSVAVFLFLTFFISITSVFAIVGHDTAEIKGGIATCKINDGYQKSLITKVKTKARENSAFFNEVGGVAEVEIHGLASTDTTDQFLNLEFGLNGIDTSLLKPGKVLLAETSDIYLLIHRYWEEGSFAIVALNSDENSNPITSKVKIRTRDIKVGDILGRTSGSFTITFPKTIVLSAEDLDKLGEISGGDSSKLEPEDINKIDLSGSEEYGSLIVTCQYKNLPFPNKIEEDAE